MVARVARFMHHPGLTRVLGVIARSESTAVREAVARAWATRSDMIDDSALEGMTVDPAVPVRRGAVQAWLGAKRWDRLRAMLADPDPGVRFDVAVAFLDAPDASPLTQLQQDPDEMVRAALFVVRVLRGETAEPPADRSVSRAAAATALRQARALDLLRDAARNALDPKARAAAALGLAVADDEMAYQTMRSDPLWSVRDQVGRMLSGWEEPPDARRRA